MAPKKKAGNKKGGNDDWEAELGETVAPAAASGPDAADDEAASAGGGGLMGLMRKNKEKRKKKGLNDDWVDGEAAGADAEQPPPAEPLPDLSAKQAEEANLDDEFALPDKKAKGGKGKQQQQKATAAAEKDEEADDAEPGRVLTKAEKEKLKKEKEKQRKKEQVRGLLSPSYAGPELTFVFCMTGRQEERCCSRATSQARAGQARHRGEEG